MCCRLSASDVRLLWASVHGSPADTKRRTAVLLDINIYVRFPSIDHPLNRKSVTSDRIVENEVLDKA